MKIVALIPARWASTRFPGKALTPILGRPMIEHVYRRALTIPGVAEVHIATDSPEIRQAALKFDGRVVMTGSHHPPARTAWPKPRTAWGWRTGT